ncbi:MULTISPECIES: DUF732 domain-containing protein [Mycobacterium]|uniref:DUF732 domain-containing protein n=1 Tax=Mycobacterium kiyosense TaxID=2871094 RepID=A0A9P3Q3P7_9MYCO|nr:MULTISPECIES: DUF732 domain-containing protein [Mycobacterium]BDB44298.1 hypothetical protein IWGMT90018_47440 [Mycobacterium kiyosense]BDE15830.1 hypothetical protein MKCMC460_46900 [Mycobacterium sp. 20KCMC460]GLB80776.1 hypothetical protein SRL2020028_00320 [Mycobacterium kiyosense]GLB87486.1 hypothetical protein SRL2020130_03030 [Mycobacterium kiyosense]GLB93256.1 hypothetical protein SRL2020226_00320 [Mycobacterium kiyosense]
MKRRTSLAAGTVALAACAVVSMPAPGAHAKPAPEVEYTYNVSVRRHFDFPNNDAVGYGYGICDKVTAGEGYPQIMGDVKNDVTPNDEFSANYLVSYAVDLLCPAVIPQLRKSAQGYRPPPGQEYFGSPGAE